MDPHGMLFGSPEDQKINLHEYLINEFQPKMGDPDILMDAYMISVTPFNTVKQKFRLYPQNRETYEKKIHMLFNEHPDYVKRLFELTFQTEWP